MNTEHIEERDLERYEADQSVAVRTNPKPAKVGVVREQMRNFISEKSFCSISEHPSVQEEDSWGVVSQRAEQQCK